MDVLKYIFSFIARHFYRILSTGVSIFSPKNDTRERFQVCSGELVHFLKPNINATPLKCGQVHPNIPEGVPAYHSYSFEDGDMLLKS